MANKEEVWKDVEEYEGIYQISNLGRVKSLERTVKGYISLTNLPERILKQNPDTRGYLMVRLYKNGIAKTKKVHRLVAKSFIPNSKNLATINHINGIKHDNRVENLEWMTYKENSIHAYKTGLNKSVLSNNGRSKLKETDVLEIMKLKSSYSQRKIAKMFSISRSVVKSIHDGKTWTRLFRIGFGD